MATRSFRSALYDLLRSDLLPVLGDGYMPNCPDGQFGVLPPDAGTRQFAALHCAKSIVKKFQDEIDSASTDKVALEKFTAANESCKNWRPPQWTDASFEGCRDAELYGEWRAQLRRFFDTPPDASAAGSKLVEDYPDYDWSVLLDAPKIVAFANNGPGSSVGSVGCTFAEKFDVSDLTYYDNHLRWLWDVRIGSGSWRDLEISRILRGLSLKQVSASMLRFVPKTVSESRTICIEPSLNTFFQKGAAFLLEQQLRGVFGIDLKRQQPVNRELAQLGSMYGSHATIDLVSASDTIAYALVKDAVPADQFKFLDWLRVPVTQFGNDSPIELHMFSTMGNAVTFPLQTAIFAAAVCAVYKIRGIPLDHRQRGPRSSSDGRMNAPTWGCNGDDIIVLREAYDDVIHLLKLLGFTPNTQKSFNDGWFRESCGADWYKGVNVRGVYCQHARDDQDLNSLINRLMAWSIAHDICLPNTLGWLKARLHRVLWVPPFEDDTAGIKVPMDALPKVKRKIIDGQLYGYSYQKWEFRSRSFSLESRERRQQLALDGPASTWGSFIYALRETWPFSPIATLLSALKGELCGGVLVRRKDESGGGGLYRTVWHWTHTWDSTPLVGDQWKHCLVSLTEDYKLRFHAKLLANRIIS